MYQLKDTIVAVSSPTSDFRVIVRLTGPQTINVCKKIFRPKLSKINNGLFKGRLLLAPKFEIDADLYLFVQPHSYTGETTAEFHIFSNSSVTQTLLNLLCKAGLRLAQPGEFTARAYLNNKIDLTEAEAVNEIISASNRLQLSAAEKVLGGHLTQTIEDINKELLDNLSLIESGLDFSQEDIDFTNTTKIIENLNRLNSRLNQLLDGNIAYESMYDLPAVGIAGATNAGKSSLCNKLLGSQRSIVSPQQKTTRDVLTGLLELSDFRCVLFDCAGLLSNPQTILDQLAQQAAVEALSNSSLVIFCVDISKTDFQEDESIFKLIRSREIIFAANKIDLLPKKTLDKKLTELKKLFGSYFLPISAKTSSGIESLTANINKKLLEITQGSAARLKVSTSEKTLPAMVITMHHKQAVTETIENISQAIEQLNTGSDEIAAVFIRNACQAISKVEHQSIDEQVLEIIFKRFCIGK